jgi:hypothetical protein
VKDAALGFRKRNRYGTFAELKNRAERLEVSEQSLKAYNVSNMFPRCLPVCSIGLMC